MSTIAVSANDSDPGAVTGWTASERESFFEAIARHRRASWRVSVASHLANFVVALISAAMMAPLFYAALCLAFDIVNLFHHVPNIVGVIGDVLGPITDKPETVPISRWIYVSLLATAPGLIWMAVLLTALRRMLRVSAMFDSGDLQARPPDATRLAEQRIANVISEMAVAANLPVPRVLITDVGCNAAVFGRDERHATIVISHALLERLDRAEMQGIAAHLIGSIANGDMSIGLQAAATLSLFGFMSRLTTVLTNPGAWRPLARIFIALLSPTKAAGRRLAEELADPFGAKDPDAAPPKKDIDTRTLRGKIEQFRSMLWLPLAGSVVITGFFTGIVCLFLLGPLLSLAWRQRKYMADATAVRLTRDPNTLSEALEKMAGADSVIAPWAAHLSVTSRPGTRGLMGNSAVPMFPSLDRRLAALAKLGAHLSQAPKKMPLKFVLIATPLFVIVGGLAGVAMFLLAWLSIPLTALFLGIPFAIVHLLLRWIGGGP